MYIKKNDSKKLSKILDSFFFETLRESGLKEFPIFKNTLVLTAEEPIGAVLLYREIEKDLCEIDYLATKIEARFKGLGRSLIEHLKIYYPNIWLELKGENLGAKSFYEKLGFKVQGVRKNYYKDGSFALNMSFRKE